MIFVIVDGAMKKGEETLKNPSLGFRRLSETRLMALMRADHCRVRKFKREPAL